jgi:glycosyltransferase involved in cell wall biosynthesis
MVETNRENRMKIVIDARQSGESTGRYVDKLIEHMYPIRPKHHFVILAKPHRIDYIKKIAPKFEVVECPYKEFTFAEQLDLLRQVRSLKADLVHFAIVQQPIFYRGKVVTTMHDLTTIRFKNPSKNAVVLTLKQWVYIAVNKIVARKSAAIITPTEFVKQDVAKFARINSRKITVTYEAADSIPDAPESIPELEGKQFIMYVGRPLPHKNLGRLIEAFALIKQSQPNLHLALVGKKDALYKQHEKDVQKANIPDVIFTGFASEGQLRWLYTHTAAYVFPSLSEGFGLPALEAMQHGAPVASSNATCLPELYQDGALYFDPLSTEDMAAKITTLLTRPDRANKIRTEGKRVASKYSWDRMAKQTLAIYEDILSR